MGRKPRRPTPTPAPAPAPIPAASPTKIGIGTWDFDDKSTALRHIESMRFGWYYNWQARSLWQNPVDAFDARVEFAPMIWGRATIDAPVQSGLNLLGFNEPDNSKQSVFSVEEALFWWPELIKKNCRLGSPATTTEQTIGEGTWLQRFMKGAKLAGLRVDFVAVHYYSDNPSVDLFRDFLLKVNQAYGLPVWVTEWALVDWNNPKRFSVDEIAAFADRSIQMLDTLMFVERHAWFAMYAGGDGWHIGTELFDSTGALTKVGDVFYRRLRGVSV